MIITFRPHMRQNYPDLDCNFKIQAKFGSRRVLIKGDQLILAGMTRHILQIAGQSTSVTVEVKPNVVYTTSVNNVIIHRL